MNTKWKVITAVMILIFCFCGSYTLFFIKHSQDDLKNFINIYTENIRNITGTIQEQTSNQYQQRIQSFLNFHGKSYRNDILESFADRDREKLLQLTTPFLKIFKQENPYFSTLSWILPDNTAFLLVHNPKKYGKNIAKMRPDVASVNKEHRQEAGFSAGPIGLQYRIVNPVEYQNRHIGAVQFGLGDGLFIDAIYKKLHIPTALVIPNEKFKFIKRSKIPAITGDSFTVQSHQIDLFRDNFDTIDWNLENQQVSLQGKDYLILKVVALNNYAGAPQAHLFVAVDISEQVAATRSHILFFVELSAIFMLFSFLILYFSYGSLLRKILDLQVVEKVNKVLEEKVTERTRALKENEKQLTVFKQFADSSSQGMGWATLDGDLVYANSSLALLLNEKDPEALLGHNVVETCYPIEEQTKIEEKVFPHVFKHGTWFGKLLLLQQNGKLIPTLNSLFLIRNEASEPAFIANIITDISEQEQMEKELLKVRKLESVGILAGGIAHDFNNILSAILGNIELASILVGEDHKAFRLLSDAQKASTRAAKLTQQLLTFAKGGDPIKESTSLSQLIQDSANFVLRGSSVSCQYDFANPLWLVNIDTGQIGQVIQNLIINARHAMPEGGHIDIRCSNIQDATGETLLNIPPGNFIKVVVQDTGIGIPENIVDKIFDPYFSTKQEGSGLGLAICHSIISKHDGYISVHSTPGTGTTFTLYLPASGKTETTTTGIASEPEVSKPARIMVMDDDKMLRDVATSLLEHLGHEVLLAVDGDEAVTQYKELQNTNKAIDLIIMDLTIPGGMGGQEAVQEILKINANAKVIVSSGYSTDPVMANYGEFGFVASISKPFNLDELSNTLKNVLN